MEILQSMLVNMGESQSLGKAGRTSTFIIAARSHWFLEQGLKRQNSFARSGVIFKIIKKARGASDNSKWLNRERVENAFPANVSYASWETESRISWLHKIFRNSNQILGNTAAMK